MTGRNSTLDVLRAVAVLLVLGRHVPPAWIPSDGMAAMIFSTWQRGGWIGVDLFFTLSGFLVSGLLFEEYKRRQTFSIVRFLIRRGFKIYPSFYVLLLISVAVAFYTGKQHVGIKALCEALFIQNYFTSLWPHTWSLAVEEHFYLFLPVALLWLLRFQPLESRHTAKFLLSLCLAILGVRLVWGFYLNPDYSHLTHLYPTHLRLDALVWGVLLRWVFAFAPSSLAWIGQVHRRWIFMLSSIGTIPMFQWDFGDSRYIQTVGLTILSICACGILVACIDFSVSNSRSVTRLLAMPLATIGSYSYSIYLWHIPCRDWLAAPLFYTGSDQPVVPIVAFMATSVVFGIVIAKLIEYPFLRLRDKLFPHYS